MAFCVPAAATGGLGTCTAAPYDADRVHAALSDRRRLPAGDLRAPLVEWLSVSPLRPPAGLVPAPPRPPTLIEFMQLYPTEDACRQAIFGHRWSNGFLCPRCGHRRAWYLHRRALLR